MDSNSINLMKKFVDKYISGEGLLVCDIGSLDVYGTFKQFFEKHRYVGLDICAGPNVDIVSDDLYRYPIEDNFYDVIISGSTLEHVKNLHKWILELKRITKQNGIICIIAPSHFKIYHPHPIDCWRIYHDGMKFLMEEIAELDILEIEREKGKGNTVTCMGVGRKK